MEPNIKETIYNWLDERFDAYIDMGCDDGADDPKDYARDQMDFYSENPSDIVGDYIEEVIEAFEDDEFFVLDHRAEIDKAVEEYYRERGYID